MRLRRRLLPVLLLVTACSSDAIPTELELEQPLPESIIAPLVVAGRDAQERLLPTITAEPGAAAIDAALADLATALESRLASRIAPAAAALREALGAAASVASAASAPDRDAILLVGLRVELALLQAGS